MIDANYFKKVDSRIYKYCPFCGDTVNLSLRNAVEYNVIKLKRTVKYSLHCEKCGLVFGEKAGEPFFETEDELIKNWNRRFIDDMCLWRNYYE